MEIIKIEILNPKAKSILKSLADLKLINIRKDRTQSEFEKLLSKLRQYPEPIPSADDIAAEVESVREKRYDK